MIIEAKAASSRILIAALGVVAANTTACSLVGTGPRAVVRPASTSLGSGAEFAPKFFAPPFALALTEDAVVRVVGPQMACSGTLVEDDLVLTSHHCVVERGAHGEFTTRLLAAKSIGIELGGDYLPWGNVGVTAVVAPPCGESGGAGDIAVLVLQRKLVGLATIPPRLDTAPAIGERVDPIGFGRCAMSGDGIHRSKRDGGPIRALTGETLELTASICPGDSGGPVLSPGDREVVGVVSLSAMDGDEHTSGPSVFARVDAYRRMFANARQIADGTSPSELPPLSCETAQGH